jgi:hypothetical protein
VENKEKDELDQYIKQKVRETLQEELKQQKPGKDNEPVEDSSITRRRFLKLAGLGAGGLALSSATGAWYSVGDSGTGSSEGSQTLSEVLGEGNDISGNDIVDGGTTVWDSSNNYIPLSAVEDIGVNDIGFDTATQEELDGHAGDIDVHHTKTSSASELTDVSADSVSDAHHVQTTSSDIDHDNTVGGTSGNPHSNSASTNHDNTAHSTNYSPQSHSHSGETIDPSTLSGNITSRSGGLTQIDTNTYKGSSQPSSPQQGDQWIDTNDQEYKIYNGSSWKSIGSTATIPDSAIARWEFEQDLTGSWGSYDGTDNTSAGYTTDAAVGSYAKSFDGTDDYVGAPTPQLTTPLSYSVWVHVDSGGMRFIANQDTPTMYIQKENDDSLAMNIYDGSNNYYVTPSETIPSNSWVHLAYVVDSGVDEARAYIDGSNVGTASDSGDITLASGHYIGASRTPGSFTSGDIDDLRIYDKALSDTEVSNLYNTGSISG